MNPGGGGRDFTGPGRIWDPQPLSNGYESYQGLKWPGLGVDHPHPSSAEVQEGADLNPHFPSAPSRNVIGCCTVVSVWSRDINNIKCSDLEMCQSELFVPQTIITAQFFVHLDDWSVTTTTTTTIIIIIIIIMLVLVHRLRLEVTKAHNMLLGYSDWNSLFRCPRYGKGEISTLTSEKREETFGSNSNDSH